MLSLEILHPKEAEINLAASKSECNRALILSHLSGNKVAVKRLSTADDSIRLKYLLDNFDDAALVDCGPAGTTFRFLTALAAFTPGKRILTGSERMLQRPIGDLVDALRSLGADIRYMQEEGFPPLGIKGISQAKTSEATISMAKSSQFASALLLVASSWNQNFTLHLTDPKGSLPYLDLTIKQIQDAGIQCFREDTSVYIKASEYQEFGLWPESDWSAASYWYTLVALSKVSLKLLGLRKDSAQGDSALVNIFKELGVDSIFDDEGVRLVPNNKVYKRFSYNFSDQPDIAQSLMACCAGLGIEGEFSGLHSLRLKETDRIWAMDRELQKFGWSLVSSDDELFQLKKLGSAAQEKIEIEDYEDHRMLMSLAPLSLVFGKLYLRNPNVVDKSYPSYWTDLEQFGAAIKNA